MNRPRAERRGVFSFCSEVLEPGRQELLRDKPHFYARPPGVRPGSELLKSWVAKLLRSELARMSAFCHIFLQD